MGQKSTLSESKEFDFSCCPEIFFWRSISKLRQILTSGKYLFSKKTICSTNSVRHFRYLTQYPVYPFTISQCLIKKQGFYPFLSQPVKNSRKIFQYPPQHHEDNDPNKYVELNAVQGPPSVQFDDQDRTSPSSNGHQQEHNSVSFLVQVDIFFCYFKIF